MKVGELFVELGIKSGNGAVTLRDFIGKMGGLKMSSLGAVGALGTIGTVIAQLAGESATAAVAFRTFSNITGLSARELQKWQIAGEQANVSAETVAASVVNLQKRLTDIQITGTGQRPFWMLGVTPESAKSVFELMDRLREASRRVQANVFSRYIGEMGLDPVMVNLLKMSDKDFATAQGAAHGMTSEQERRALDFMLAYKKLWLEVRDLGRDFIGTVMPGLSTGLGMLNDLLDVVHNANVRGADGTRPVNKPVAWKDSMFYKLFVDSGRVPAAAAPAKATIEVKLTGDRNDAGLVDQIKEAISSVVSTTEAQIVVPESPSPEAVK